MKTRVWYLICIQNGNQYYHYIECVMAYKCVTSKIWRTTLLDREEIVKSGFHHSWSLCKYLKMTVHFKGFTFKFFLIFSKIPQFGGRSTFLHDYKKDSSVYLLRERLEGGLDSLFTLYVFKNTHRQELALFW